MKTYAIRLKPGMDLKQELVRFTNENQIQAGAILTCVGSLQKAVLRLANQDAHTVYEEKFEIVSLTGTLSTTGVHLHIAVADASGKVIGGHLVNGCIIYTTAEIVIGSLEQYRFSREQDDETGYLELKINQV